MQEDWLLVWVWEEGSSILAHSAWESANISREGNCSACPDPHMGTESNEQWNSWPGFFVALTFGRCYRRDRFGKVSECYNTLGPHVRHSRCDNVLLISFTPQHFVTRYVTHVRGFCPPILSQCCNGIVLSNTSHLSYTHAQGSPSGTMVQELVLLLS